MSEKYSLLYSSKDLINLLTYLDGFAKASGMNYLDIDTGKCQSILAIMENDFPHNGGIDKASPFKKIANFVTYFVSERPIKTKLPDSFIKSNCQINKISNHQNAVLAYHIAVDSLYRATINREDETQIILKNKIIVSEHSYVDIIDMLSTVRPADHFKSVTLLFEQLAYRLNPEAAYPPSI